MLVSHTHKFIFLKTRKTAGTSVENYFIPYCMGPSEKPDTFLDSAYVSSAGIIGKRGAKPDPGGLQFWNHMSARRLRKALGRDIWDSYFRFSTMRNPFEKIISMFFFRRNKEQGDQSHPETVRKEFNSWCVEMGFAVDRGIYFINGEYVLDDVVRVESIENDMARICSRLDICWDKKLLGKEKVGIRPAWATAAYMYGKEARETIETAYSFEIDFFGYSFPE